MHKFIKVQISSLFSQFNPTRVSAVYEPSSGVLLIKGAFQMLDLLMTLVILCTILEHKNTRS
jgi:hypothetical protein